MSGVIYNLITALSLCVIEVNTVTVSILIPRLALPCTAGGDVVS